MPKNDVFPILATVFTCLWLGACPDDEPPSEHIDDAGAAESPLDAAAPEEPAADAKVAEKKPGATNKDAGAPDSTTPEEADEDAGTEPRPSGSTSNAGAAAPAPIAGEIETVMMQIRYVFNGSGVLPVPRPIILFKDGTATVDINFVVRGLDVAAHKAMFANTWTQWKLIDGDVALQDGMNWTKLDFQIKYPPNPSSLTFDDAYEHLSGATIGETSAFSQQSVRFFADHKMIWGSVTGVISPNTTIGSFPPDQRGTYQIDGYTIQFTWDDGKTTKSSFVWNDSDPEAIFIAGAGYTLVD